MQAAVFSDIRMDRHKVPKLSARPSTRVSKTFPSKKLQKNRKRCNARLINGVLLDLNNKYQRTSRGHSREVFWYLFKLIGCKSTFIKGVERKNPAKAPYKGAP